MSERSIKDRPCPSRIAGELSQALAHHAAPDVISAYRTQLATTRAERALRRALDQAPPLTAAQVAYLRSVLDAYHAEGVEPAHA